MSSNQENFLKSLLIILLITLTFIFSPPAFAADTVSGTKIFSVQCAGCHVNGGNIIRRGKTLKKRALKKYGMDSFEAIASLVANGKSNMPAFKDRLSEKQIEDVTTYVLEQAEKGWR